MDQGGCGWDEGEDEGEGMRQIGEQFTHELIDEKNHMLKAIEKIGGCVGCDLQKLENCYGLCDASKGNDKIIIKDLGILNEDGCLPAPWNNNLYPKIINEIYFGESVYRIHADEYPFSMDICYRKNKNEAIDAWNRRT